MARAVPGSLRRQRSAAASSSISRVRFVLLPVKAMIDDDGAFGVILLVEAIVLQPPFPCSGALGETLDPGLPDRTLATLWCRFPPGGIVFGALSARSDLEVERRCSYRINDDQFRRHGAAEIRIRTRHGGRVDCAWPRRGVPPSTLTKLGQNPFWHEKSLLHDD